MCKQHFTVLWVDMELFSLQIGVSQPREKTLSETHLRGQLMKRKEEKSFIFNYLFVLNNLCFFVKYWNILDLKQVEYKSLEKFKGEMFLTLSHVISGSSYKCYMLNYYVNAVCNNASYFIKLSYFLFFNIKTIC